MDRIFLDDLAFWRPHNDISISEQAAPLHHRAAWIHPFLNGNGRWSRLLANIYLRRTGSAVTVWPEETVGDASVIREEYLKAIRDAGDYAQLIQLHDRYAERR